MSIFAFSMALVVVASTQHEVSSYGENSGVSIAGYTITNDGPPPLLGNRASGVGFLMAPDHPRNMARCLSQTTAFREILCMLGTQIPGFGQLKSRQSSYF